MEPTAAWITAPVVMRVQTRFRVQQVTAVVVKAVKIIARVLRIIPAPVYCYVVIVIALTSIWAHAP